MPTFTTTAEEMYGAMFDHDEGDDDESVPITFVQGINLERLAIEAFIDLANPKLIARFQDSESPTTSTPGSQAEKGKANNSQAPSHQRQDHQSGQRMLIAQWASNDLDW